jgi:signal transduction histidine kinase
MADAGFAELVSLACHDLRTPLATVNGFAKTLLRGSELGDREERFLGLIDQAAGQMASLLDLLGLAARIQGGRYDPAYREANTLALAMGQDQRVTVTGSGEAIETDPTAVQASLQALAVAALRHGDLDRVTWTVSGRDLELAPVTADAAPVVRADDTKDLGAMVARMAIEALGGSLALDGETLRVRL